MKSRRDVKVGELEETLKNQFKDKIEDKSIAIVTRAKAKVNQEFVMMFVENAQTALNDLTKSEFKVLLSIAKLAQYQNVFNVTQSPDGQFKFPHPWPPQIPPGSAVRL